MQPLISVIIPVYNVDKYLRQCLDTVINQTLKDIEIICVDDGSTDKSLDILNEYKEKDNRITILTQQNKYAGVARNNGLKIAKGEYLIFLDSDDFFELTMLEEMYNKAKKDNSDIVVCGWYNFNNNLKKVIRNITIKQKFLDKSPFSPSEVADDLFNICKPNPWTKLFKHEFFINNNLYFEDLICCNDLTCICTAMVTAKKISIINKPFIYYRSSQGTNLTAGRSKNFDSILHALDRLEKKLKSLNLYNTYKKTFLWKAKSSINYKLLSTSSNYQLEERKKLAKNILSNELFTELYGKTINNNTYYVRPQVKKKYKFF